MEYLEDTPRPTSKPVTYGQCVYDSIPDWAKALEAANLDKRAIKEYVEGMK